MRNAVVSVALFVMLGGCPGPNPGNTIAPTPTPTSTADPIPWPDANLNCNDPGSRAEWIVCGDPALLDLHRKLAAKLESGNYAGDLESQLAADQAYALASELRLCSAAPCVSRAYRRFLYDPPLTATKPPVVAPTPRPTPAHRPIKPRPHRRPHGQRPGHARGDRDEGSCLGSAGPAAAQFLVRQCKEVNGGVELCTPYRSCNALRDQIQNGCRGAPHKPGFCRR